MAPGRELPVSVGGDTRDTHWGSPTMSRCRHTADRTARQLCATGLIGRWGRWLRFVRRCPQRLSASASGRFRPSSREQSSGGLAGNTSTTWVRPDDATATSRDLYRRASLRGILRVDPLGTAIGDCPQSRPGFTPTLPKVPRAFPAFRRVRYDQLYRAAKRRQQTNRMNLK